MNLSKAIYVDRTKLCSGNWYESTAKFYTNYTYSVLPERETITEFFYDDGHSEIGSVVNRTDYTYYNHKNVKSITQYASNGDVLRTEYKYSRDVADDRYTDDFGQAVNELERKHIIVPIEKVSYKNNSPVRAEVYEYGLFAGLNNTAQLKKEYIWTNKQSTTYSPIGLTGSVLSKNPVLQLLAEVDLYNEKGRPRQITFKENQRVVYLWSFYDWYPMAAIKNVNYGQVSTLFPNEELENAEKYFLEKSAVDYIEDKLRNDLANAQIHFYNYNVLGLMSKIGSAQETNAFFSYDQGQRLENIYDNDRNIIKHYDYFHLTGLYDKVYLNSRHSGFFRKQGCSTGFYGSEILYEVPVGRYYSVISQNDADYQASQDLFFNGRAYANASGQCLPEGTYVSLCDIGYRTVMNGNYLEIYTTYVIKVYKDPEGRYYKNTPVNVTFYHRGANSVISVTGSYVVGELLSFTTYIPNDPNEEGPEFDYTPDIVHSPNYQRITVPCNGQNEEEEEEEEVSEFVQGNTYNMVHFQNLPSLCSYTADTEVDIMEIYYYDDPQSEAKFFTDNTRQSVIGSGYYTFYKQSDSGPNEWYRIEDGIIVENGICQGNNGGGSTDFVQGYTYNMVLFQNLPSLCSYTADTEVDITEVHYYDDPQSEAKFFTDNTRQSIIGNGYYTFYRTVDNGPNKWFRIEGGVIIDSGVCEEEEEPEEEVFAQGHTYDMVFFENLYTLCSYTADMDMDIMEVYYYDDPQSEAKFFSDSSRQFVPEDGYYTFYKTVDNGPNKWFLIVGGVMVGSGICQ